MATTSAEEMAQALSKASSTEAIYRALVNIRTKLIQQPQGIHILRTNEGLKYLLNYVTKPNMKILDISLSILGNCCLDAEVRREVKRLKGITHIVTVLKGLEMGSIQNRACRTLANLALDKEIAKVLHEVQAVPVIVSFLTSTKDPLNQQTAIRALRILADTKEHRDAIIHHDGLKTIAEHLTTKDVEVLKCALKATAHLTENCTEKCSEQMFPGRYLQYLVTLSSHEDVAIREKAVATLVNFAHEKTIRPSLGSAGAIRVFIKETIEYIESDEKPCGDAPVYALCMCSIDSVNRRRIRNYKGLGALMAVFEKEHQSLLQEKILEAFMNYIWDSENLKELQALGIISILVEKLYLYLKSEIKDHNMGEETMKWQIRNRNADPMELVTRPPAAQLPEENEPDKTLQEIPSELEWTERPFYRIDQCHPSYMSEMKRQNKYETKQRYFYYYNEEDWKNSFQFKFPIPDFANEQHLLDKHGKFFPCVYVPEWHSPERYPPRTRWEDDAFHSFHHRMFYHHRSPRSLSPMSISPTSSTPCYSPCEFSEEEDSGMESETDKHKRQEEDNWRNIIINDDKELKNEGNETLMETVRYEFNPERFPTLLKNCYWLDEKQTQNKYVGHILAIMQRCSQSDKPLPQLLSSTCIETLLTCLMFAGYRKLVEPTLLALAGNNLCLEALILMHFPDQINTLMSDSSDEAQSNRHLAQKVFDKISNQCQTSFGQGEIERIMTAGKPDDKLSAILMVPFVDRRRKSLLKKFYLEMNGLTRMMDVLGNQHHEYFDVAIRSCAKALETLAVKSPPRLHLRTDNEGGERVKEVSNFCIYKNDGQPKDVKFVLDSNKAVKGNRAILSRNSEVFNVMLQGSFSEALSCNVRFGESSVFALEYVVHFLHGCDYAYDQLDYETRRKQKSSTSCPLFSETMEELFEVFVLADRLLLSELQTQVFNKIVRLIETPEKAVEVYNLAFNHRLEMLAKTAFFHVIYYFGQTEQAVFLKTVLTGDGVEFAYSTLRETLLVKIAEYETEMAAFYRYGN